MIHTCGICGRKFSRKLNLKRHQSRFHNNTPTINCSICKISFDSVEKYKEHRELNHNKTDCEPFQIIQTALNRTLITYSKECKNSNSFDDLKHQEFVDDMTRVLNFETSEKSAVKFSLVVTASFTQHDYFSNVDITEEFILRSGAFEYFDLQSDTNDISVSSAITEVEKRAEELCLQGSNWVLEEILKIDIEIGVLKPLRVGQSTSIYDLNISNTHMSKHLINFKNLDQFCFLYCVVHSLFGDKIEDILDLDRYKDFFNIFNVEGIDFPISLEQIKIFLKQNQHLDLNISILYMETKSESAQDRSQSDKKTSALYPYAIDLGGGQHQVNLLLHQYFIDKVPINHFCLITDVDRFIRTKYQNDNDDSSYSNSFYCLRCLLSFKSASDKERHMETCSKGSKLQKSVFPNPGEKMKFTHHKRKVPAPIVGYLDFESILTPIENECSCRSDKCRHKCSCEAQNLKKCECASFTIKKNIHLPIAYSLVFVSSKNELICDKSYFGSDAAENLVEFILSKQEDLNLLCQEYREKPLLTEEEQLKHDRAVNCYLCGVDFKKGVVKVLDHDHLTGDVIGAACQTCNLNRVAFEKIDIYLHNGGRYDFKLILKALSKVTGITKQKISVLPKNNETFRTISIGKFTFKDSLDHLQGSLDQLAKDLAETPNFKYELFEQSSLLSEFSQEKRDELLFLLTRGKSVFPYEYCTSKEKMEKTTALPPIEQFYSTLSGKNISEEDYRIGQKIWQDFNVESLRDYALIYCRTDTLLLAEVFQEYRSCGYEAFGLDPSFYMGTPGYAMDCMLYFTGVELDLLSDPDMTNFSERAVRGGMSLISTRYCEGETRLSEPGKHIAYWDANSLYSSTQQFKLPISNYEWIVGEELEKISTVQAITEMETDGEEGFLFEVDLDYDQDIDLHYKHNHMTLAPYTAELSLDDLSPYNRELYESQCPNKSYQATKLLATFHPRKNYVCHLKNLQYYLANGLKLKCVHKVLKFNQSNYLSDFIDKCITMRTETKSPLKKKQYKLINNATYGKFIEDPRKYGKINIVFTESKCKNNILKPSFKKFFIIDEDCVVIEHTPYEVVFNRPYPVGVAILELSKLFMFRLYYDVFQHYFGVDNTDLLFTDTDSFCLQLTTKNFLKDMKQLDFLFDFSKYPKNHPLYSTENAGRAFYFKDELAGQFVAGSFCGLRPKCYSIKVHELNLETMAADDLNMFSQKQAAKGVKRNIIHNHLKFGDYVECLKTGVSKSINYQSITSLKHQLYSTAHKKIGLAAMDSKRYIFNCGIHSASYGSLLINKEGRCPFCQL